MSHPLLTNYPPSEQRAIWTHLYFLGTETGREPALAEAIQSWETHFAQRWRREKALRDVEAQLQEINRHKYLLSEKAGRDVGWEAAASDWIKTHASAWREWWERLER